MPAKRETIEFHTRTPVPLIQLNVITPRAFEDDKGRKGEPKYSGTLLFDADSEDFKAFKDACIRAAKEAWPGLDLAAEYKAKRLRVPWTTGEAYIAKREATAVKKGREYNASYDEYAVGKVLVRASTKQQPALGYVLNGKGVDLTEEGQIKLNQSKFYSGVIAYAQLNIVAYDAIDEYSVPGITAYLQRVLTTGKGQRIGGVRSASEVFSGYLGRSSEIDPTDGLDEDIPF